jgi:thioredoxin-like negative regulator of GroEL
MILCWASWDNISENLKSMMEEMPKIYKNITFLYIDCDEAEDIIDYLNVDTV